VSYQSIMQPITSTKKLAEACTRLAKYPFVTVDTEFQRETTYYPKLCIAQIASSDEAVVVDALAEDIDLTPFFELMADKRVIKVFHAARQDIEICWHAAEIIPTPLVDTQVAAMVLGYGDSISYEQLVQRITGDSLDKSHRFTDWTRRPLAEAQLAYAVSDVTHLRDVYVKLAADLEERGRTECLPNGAGARLGAPEDARAQAQGARHPDRGRELARARGAHP
jgi:ribonuclease D